MAVCVLFVSSRSGIIFNLSAGAITDHSQSAKATYPYFKSQLYAGDPSHRKTVLILPNRLTKVGERAHDRNFISAMGGIRIHKLLINSSMCYHRSITTLRMYTESNKLYFSINLMGAIHCKSILTVSLHCLM